ncbi:MAG TPA: ECF-type sigma factor [Gemmataceae bacterium]|nr:ECF-type sigma factor [Gemmataceae bacterium]
MSSAGSVTLWIGKLQAGDAQAAQELWERYFRRLVGIARQQLQGTPRAAADEEDVALSAFDSLCRGADAGRFPQLHDRDDLWQLLVALTVHKALDLVRHQSRQKRGGGAVLDEAALAIHVCGGAEETRLEQVIGREPTPEFALLVEEECQRLLRCLDDDTLRSVVLRKMEGHSIEDIAAQLGCAPRTVARKLRRIRTVWSREVLG